MPLFVTKLLRKKYGDENLLLFQILHSFPRWIVFAAVAPCIFRELTIFHYQSSKTNKYWDQRKDLTEASPLKIKRNTVLAVIIQPTCDTVFETLKIWDLILSLNCYQSYIFGLNVHNVEISFFLPLWFYVKTILSFWSPKNCHFTNFGTSTSWIY